MAFASAKLAAWHSEYVAEQSLLNDGVIAPEAEPIEVVWQPPSWIPESVLKLGPTAWFAHIYELNFGTREDLPIDRIRKLRHLQVLKCAAPKAEDVAQVADFSSLRELRIDGPGIDATAIKALRRLPKLRSLTIDGVHLDDTAVRELNGIASLEELQIGRNSANTFGLQGAATFKTLDLRGLVSLKSLHVTSDGDWRPVIRLTDLPQLSQVNLSNATFDVASQGAIAGLPALEFLSINNCRFSGPLEIAGAAHLQKLSITDCDCGVVALRDMPMLDSLDIERNPISSLTLESIPRLPRCEPTNCPFLRDLSLRDLPGLQSLSVDISHADSPCGYVGVFRLQQAEGLGSLREFALRGCRFDAATATNIAGLTGLTKLGLYKSWCRDADVEQFGGLTRLTECDLSFTDVTAKGQH